MSVSKNTHCIVHFKYEHYMICDLYLKKLFYFYYYNFNKEYHSYSNEKDYT